MEKPLWGETESGKTPWGKRKWEKTSGDMRIHGMTCFGLFFVVVCKAKVFDLHAHIMTARQQQQQEL